MSNPPPQQASPSRPFSDPYLLAYSVDHVEYEFDMLLWLGAVLSKPRRIDGLRAEATRLNNSLIEAFAVHARNVIEFLYPDTVRSTDVIAADFFETDAWVELRPAISATLKLARVRANKEIAHLTTNRISGNPPEKSWNVASLMTELRPLMRLFATKARLARSSPELTSLFADHQTVTPP